MENYGIDVIINSVKKAMESGTGKIALIDENGNIISDISFSDLKNAIIDLKESLVGEDNYNLTTLQESLTQILGGIKLDTDRLDVKLSTRASEDTVSDIKLKVDKIQFDEANNVKISVSSDEVGLSKDDTLQKIVNALKSVGTDKILIAVSEDDVGIAKDSTLQDVKSELAQSCILNQHLSYSNTGTTTANYTVLSSDLSIDFNGAITIQIIMNISTTVQLNLTPSGSTITYTGYLNDGSALTSNSWYEFEFNVNNGDAINFIIQVPAGDTLSGLIRLFKRER